MGMGLLRKVLKKGLIIGSCFYVGINCLPTFTASAMKTERATAKTLRGTVKGTLAEYLNSKI